jgi:hypothetical protein
MIEFSKPALALYNSEARSEKDGQSISMNLKRAKSTVILMQLLYRVTEAMTGWFVKFQLQAVMLAGPLIYLAKASLRVQSAS